MTGKGDRWGRDRIGRSAPAFLAAGATALPPSACTARREAGRHRLRLLFLLRGRPTAGCCFEACAGRRVRRLCLPAVPCSAGCVPVHPLPCHAHCPSQRLPPFILLCPCSFHVRQDRQVVQQFASCKTVLLAAATRACSGGPCAGSLLTYLFPAESMILGHGCSVNLYVKMCVVNMCTPPACLCHSAGNVVKLSE